MKSTPAHNSVHPLAAQFETVSEAFRDGARDAAQAAESVMPAVSEAVGKTVYAASYYASYGICFAGLLVYRAIPGHEPIGRGVSDGAADAKKAVDAMAPPNGTSKPRRKSSKRAAQPAAEENVDESPSGRKKLRAEAARRARGEIYATAETLTSDSFLSE